MIVGGTAISAREVYVARKGGAIVGVLLLAVAALWARNLHYYWVATYNNAAPGAPFRLLVSPVVLIVLGVFFAAFFRYLYPLTEFSKPTSREASAPSDKILGEPVTPEPAQLQSAPRSAIVTPWYRLFLLTCSVGVALLAGYLAGIADSVARAQVVIFVLVLGCLATGLISEQTLTKIIPWKKD